MRIHSRSRLERGAVAVAVAFLAAMSAGGGRALAQAPVIPWPSFQGGPAHAGAAGAGPRPPMTRAWVVSAPGNDARLSAAVVVPGLGVATGRNSLVAFDPITGTVRWTVQRASGPLVPAAIDDAGGRETVVYLEGSSASDSALVAVDAATQRRRWRVALGAEAIGAPTVDGGTVFAGSRDQHVYAVNVASGSAAWTARLEGPVDTPPAVGDGNVYVVSQSSTGRSRLYALNEATGRVSWSFSPHAVSLNASSPTVAGGRVFVGFGDGTVRAFDAGSGRLAWTQQVRGDFISASSPAIWDANLYVLDAEGGLYRMDLSTGSRRWDFQFQSFTQSSSAMVSGGWVYAGLVDGTVAAVSAASGHLVWRARLGFGSIGALSPAGELLLAPAIGPGGGIVAFQHDPSAALLDVHSPSELRLPEALMNYAAAIVLVLGLVFGFFSLMGRGVARRMASGGRDRNGTAGEPAAEGEDA